MPFLYIKDGEVFPTEEGKTLEVVKNLYNSDKTESKKFYKDVLIYVFYVYRKGGIYDNQFHEFRKKTVIERHLPKRVADELEQNPRVIALIKEYLDRQLSKSEQLLYQLEIDIDNLLKRISSIPYTKKAKVKIPHETDEGTQMIPAEIEVDNSKEKFEALKLAETLVDYGNKLKTKITQESTEKKKKTHDSRVFDKKMT